MAEGFSTEGMLDMYLFENTQLLERLQEIVLEQKDQDCFDEDSINEIFRTMHTIKGSSGVMMFDEITAVSHKLEDVFFVDLPGYGYAKVAKSEKRRWADLIEGYLNADRNIELVFLLIDMRHAPSEDDIHMINFLIDAELPFVIILTKADKLNKTNRAKMMSEFAETIPYFDDIHVIPFSSQTFEGVEEVRRIIEETAEEARSYSADEEID